ncbi:hypothetical protein [Mesoaciditoga lauensis]|uniref:hypothetical protein n=1 Tax=Mesoaciditoga lauensis TaxID=1495039 RepID=UPI000565E159|nr:hypothetical protein [Mesoaciditoga lauensis]
MEEKSAKQVVCPWCGSIVYANIPPVPTLNVRDANDMGGAIFSITVNSCPECGNRFYVVKDENGAIRLFTDICGFYWLSSAFEREAGCED